MARRVALAGSPVRAGIDLNSRLTATAVPPYAAGITSAPPESLLEYLFPRTRGDRPDNIEVYALAGEVPPYARG